VSSIESFNPRETEQLLSNESKTTLTGKEVHRDESMRTLSIEENTVNEEQH